MDKLEFTKNAPIYYALAICVYFRKNYTPAYRGEIKSYFYIPEDQEDEECNFLEHDILFERAIAWLEDKGLIEAIKDSFGPSIYRQAPDFSATWDELSNKRDLPFYNYNVGSNGEGWLRSALLKVNETYTALGITPENFDAPDNEWQPLPLDRNEPSLKGMVEALDAVVEQVRGDNGYNANIPQERDYVLRTLGDAVKTLKTEVSTNVQYIRAFVLEPLGILLSRFKDAAIGIAANAAKSAVIEFLKQHGVKLLGAIFGL